jgi:hypothetical protein
MKPEYQQRCPTNDVLFVKKLLCGQIPTLFVFSPRFPIPPMRAYLQQHAHLTAAELELTLAVVRPCTFRKGTGLFHPGPPPLFY